MIREFHIHAGQSNRQGAACRWPGPRAADTLDRAVSRFTGETDPYPGSNNSGQGGSMFPYLQDLAFARGVRLTIKNYAIGGASVFDYTGRAGATITNPTVPRAVGYVNGERSGGTTVQVEGDAAFDPLGLLAPMRVEIQKAKASGRYSRVVVSWSNGESDLGSNYDEYASALKSMVNYWLASGADDVYIGLTCKIPSATTGQMDLLQSAINTVVLDMRGQVKNVHYGSDLYAHFQSNAPFYPETPGGPLVHLTLRGQERAARVEDKALVSSVPARDALLITQPVTLVAAYFGGWKNPMESGVTWFSPNPWGYVPSNDITMGDYPERFPLYGPIDEDNQSVIEGHLQLAESAGISVFAVNWYKDEYLNYAANRIAAAPMTVAPSVKWCLQWSNHYSETQTFAHSKAYYLDGILKAARRMNGDRYWRKSGRPVFILFSSGHLDDVIATAKGEPLSYNPTLTERNALIADTRNIIGNVLAGDNTGGISGTTVSVSANQGPYLVLMTNDSGWANVTGIDALTNYNVRGATFGGVSRLAHSYSEIHWAVRVAWRTKRAWAAAAGIKAWPCVTTGWDSRPWGGTAGDPLADNCKPPNIQAFKDHLLTARLFAQDSVSDRTAFLFAWNEFGEGGWVQPTPEIGTSRLDALKLLTASDISPYI